MTENEVTKINQEISDLMILFQEIDSKMAWIKANDEYKYFSREEIEILQYELSQAYKYTENNLLINLLNLKQNLENSKEHKNLLDNINNLELTIKKFWYKFFWKFKESSKDTEFLKWKTAYLDCYKKPFENQWKETKDFIKKINNENEIQQEKKLKSVIKSITV